MRGQLDRIFGGLKLGYFARSYAIGAIISGLWVWHLNSTHSSIPAFYYVIIGLQLVCFPFAKIVYDVIAEMIMGGNVVMLPAIIFLLWKMIVNIALFIFSPFIAPFGLLYLWIVGGRR
ncbi:MAG: hypothetical protein SNH79_04435 [Rikenellaceae bacterium]